jgi:hypothetical protein
MVVYLQINTRSANLHMYIISISQIPYFLTRTQWKYKYKRYTCVFNLCRKQLHCRWIVSWLFFQTCISLVFIHRCILNALTDPSCMHMQIIHVFFFYSACTCT